MTKSRLIILVGAALALLYFLFQFLSEDAPTTFEEATPATAGAEDEVGPRRSRSEESDLLATDRSEQKEPDVATSEASAAKPVAVPTIRVRCVRNSDDTAVVGAEVFVDAYAMKDERARLDLEKSLESYRKHLKVLRSDEEGLILLPYDTQNMTLRGFSESGVAEAYINGFRSEVRLPFFDVLRIPVRVVDPDGKALDGVGVSLRQQVMYGTTFFNRMSARTDAQGLVGIEAFVSPYLRRERHVVAVEGVFRDPVDAEINLDAIPEEPITLTRPACGRIVVEVKNAAGRNDELPPLRVELRKAGGTRDATTRSVASCYASLVENASALFENVGLGLDLEVDLVPSPLAEFRVMSQQVQGPLRLGEELRVVFELPAEPTRAIVSGELREPDGNPLTSTRCRFETRVGSEAKSQQRTIMVTTDAEGRFRFVLDPADPNESTGFTGEFKTMLGNNVPARASVDLTTLVEGPNDLGIIPLVTDPLICSGRVTDRAGVPLGEVTLRVQPGRTSRGRRGPALRELIRLETKTASDGSFAIHGKLSLGEFELQASCKGHAQTRTPFQVGTSGLLVELVAFGHVKAQIEIQGEGRMADLRCRFVPAEVGLESGPVILLPVPEDGRLEIPQEPGELILHIYSAIDVEEPLYRSPAFRVSEKEVTDLGLIRVEHRLPILHIKFEGGVRDPWGNSAVILRDPATGALLNRTNFGGDTSEMALRVEKLPVDVEVQMAGCRDQRRIVNRWEETFKLETGIAVVIAFPELDDLPADLSLRVSFEKTDEESANKRTIDSRFGNNHRVPVTAFLPGPGSYELVVHAGWQMNGGVSSMPVDLPSKPVIEVRDQAATQFIEVEVDRARVVEIVERLKR